MTETATLSVRRHRPESLAGIVDGIWDWAIETDQPAYDLAVRKAPGTSILLMVPYRLPKSLRQEGFAAFGRPARPHGIARHTGALGIIVVALKPAAAWRVLGAPLAEFADADLSLPQLFGAQAAADCCDQLVAARTSAERAGIVEAFLLRRLKPWADTVAGHAADRLGRTPALRMKDLAASLGVSARHVRRAFQAEFAMSPKSFARLARLDHVIRHRRRGLSWTELAYACGLADQAHLTREFKSLVGRTPTDFFSRRDDRTLSIPLSGHLIARPSCLDVRSLQSPWALAAPKSENFNRLTAYTTS